MIKIQIRETGDSEELSMILGGVDHIDDFIGNHGGFADGDFVWDAVKDAYVCDQETFESWSKLVADNLALEERIESLKETYGADRVYKVLERTRGIGLDAIAQYANELLDDAFTPDGLDE